MSRRTIKVLLVDDDRTAFEICKRYLAQAPRNPYQLEWVNSADEGQIAIERQEHDVYLVDHYLGGSDGIELVGKTVALGCDRPIIVVTGSNDHEADERALGAGAADYLSKERLDPFVLHHAIRYALESWRMRGKLEKRAEQLDTLRHRVQQQSRKLDTVLANSPDEVYLFGLDGKYAFVNRKQRVSVGAGHPGVRSLEEIALKEDDDTEFQHDLSRVLIESQNVRGEIHYANGAHSIEYDIRPVRDSLGTVTGAVCHARDISDRKRAGHALKMSEQRFRASAEVSLDAFLVFRVCVAEDGAVTDFSVVEANTRACKMMGRSRTLLMGQYLSELLPGPYGRRLIRLYSRVYQSGRPDEREYDTRALHIDAEWMHQQVVALDDGVTITLRDVSDRKASELALTMSEDRLNMAMEASDIGLWDWDVETDHVLVNDEFGLMLGFEQGYRGGTRNQVASLIHPEDRSRADRLYREHATSRDDSYECEVRMRTVQGDWKWIQQRGRVVKYGNGGNPLRVIGTNIDVNERRLAADALQKRALYDPLTALGNRNMLEDRLAAAKTRMVERKKGALALLFLDLDSFKRVNDSLGHAAGDELLRAVAVRLAAGRDAQDTVVRFGGDEFAVILQSVESLESVLNTADQVHNSLSDAFNIQGRKITVTTSIGVVYQDCGEHEGTDDMLRDADVAMYRAKEMGPGQTAVFSIQMKKEADIFLEVQSQIRTALEKNQFELYYQPIVNLEDGSIKGAEALIRWRHPSGRIASPDEFLPVAQRSGVADKIDDWVMRAACAQVVEWQQAALLEERFQLNVNVSGDQVGDTRFADNLARLLGQCGVTPNRLVVELTESTLISNAFSAGLSLSRVRAMGLTIALDDFGTGYSSLSHLHDFPLQIVKIDRSFVSKLGEQGRGGKIVAGMISLAKSLGLKVTAEGIETLEQAHLLQDLDCEFGQGYYFSKPVPAAEMSQLLSSRHVWPLDRLKAVKSTIASGVGRS